MDRLDLKALETLVEQGRITWAELASVLGLSAPAAADRVRQLENTGVILHYAAILDPTSLGFNLTAFIAVSMDRPRNREAFLEAIQNMPEIQECHHVAGDDDYLLKVRCINTRHLDWLLTEQIKSIEGVTRTRTTIVLNTYKETASLPLPQQLSYQD
ncbi:MAG: Lrp/AsnC family transcriptional regulator [Anaerolineae bacterium]|nr:Lrp/AsnC family transcriptional regulator [Anaerolineae bacterium]